MPEVALNDVEEVMVWVNGVERKREKVRPKCGFPGCGRTLYRGDSMAAKRCTLHRAGATSAIRGTHGGYYERMK